MEQAPAGFLPRVFYGLTTGNQTYRFTEDAEITITIAGEIGTAYEFYSISELSNDYIPAIAVKTAENTLKIVIKGDYTMFTGSLASYQFKIVNMTTGASITETMSGVLSLQNASSLLDYPAQQNGNKQITVINSLETNTTNVVYASLDYNSDNVFNWIEIGRFVDGRDGKCVYSISSGNYNAIKAVAKEGDSLISAEEFTADSYNFTIGAVIAVLDTDPWTLQGVGNIRGPQGETGATGQDGADGADGYTPYIQDGYWYINGVNTNVKAIGTDGTNGTNGQSFQMQSGLYSTPDNWGKTGNVDGDGNPLLQLPTLPQSNITGKGYVVYDPLTTPLAPYYDLYYANNGDNDWTIIHPFSGIAGTNGTNGSTPYIQNGNWYIDGVNTGVPATGPQGPAGPGVPSGGTAGQVLKKVSGTDYDTTWGAPLDTSNVPSGTIDESIGFDNLGNVVRGSAGGGSLYAYKCTLTPKSDSTFALFEFRLLILTSNNNLLVTDIASFKTYISNNSTSYQSKMILGNATSSSINQLKQPYDFGFDSSGNIYIYYKDIDFTNETIHNVYQPYTISSSNFNYRYSKKQIL